MTCLAELRSGFGDDLRGRSVWQFSTVDELRTGLGAGRIVAAERLIAATGARRRADRVREADVRTSTGPRSRDRFAGLGMLTRARRTPRLWRPLRKRPTRPS